MADTTTVAFRLDESVKQEWEQAAERPEYESLSHLIRLAVQREIADSDTASRTAQADTQTDDGEVLQSINRVERIVEDVRDEVETIGREETSDRSFSIKQVLLEVLPTAPGSYAPGSPGDPAPEDVGETPHEIAGRIGADTSVVEDALESLEDGVGQVRVLHNHYWRTEE